MLTIWKFPPYPEKRLSEINVPADARLLCAHEQKDVACLWFEVEPKSRLVVRRFAMTMTGESPPKPPASYVGTAFLFGGDLVIHIYELL